MKGTSVMLVAASIAIAGCVRVGPVATQDSLTTWQPVPLVADPKLAEAARSSFACLSEQQGPLQIVLQDQRTASTAAFLTAGAGFSGSCLVSVSGGTSAGSARAEPPAPMTGAISADERSSGGAGGGSATLLGGRIDVRVTRVEVEIVGGQRVTASVGNGHWLAWWPDDVVAARVVAFDSNGLGVASLTDTTPGYLQK